jgi:predicted TIM-barrel enzyme
VLIGSGFGIQNASALLPTADGAIVGTSLKCSGRVSQPVDEMRVSALRAAMNLYALPTAA